MLIKRMMLLTIGSAFIITLLFSCAKPPEAEMNAAVAAVAKAGANAQVREYAPDSLKLAQDALASMRNEGAAKKYDAAKSHALEAVRLADQAVADGAARYEQLKAEATEAMNALHSTLAEAQETLSALMRSTSLQAREAEAAFAEIEKTVNSAENDYASGNYKSAIENSRKARSALADLIRDISESAQALSRKK